MTSSSERKPVVQASYWDKLALQAHNRLSGWPCLVWSYTNSGQWKKDDNSITPPPPLSFLLNVANPLGTKYF